MDIYIKNKYKLKSEKKKFNIIFYCSKIFRVDISRKKVKSFFAVHEAISSLPPQGLLWAALEAVSFAYKRLQHLRLDIMNIAISETTVP